MRIIGGEWRGRRLNPPKGKDVRPTTDRVRESWMSAMGGRFDHLTVADLFAGSGALGLETLSRGAEHVTFVERADSSVKVIRSNISLVGAGPRSTVVARDALKFATDLGPHSFDLVLADPPYGQGLAAALLEHFSITPFAFELWVEHRSDEPVPELPGLRQRRYGDTTLSILESDS